MARDSRVGVSYQHRQESATMSPQIFILVNCEIEDKKKFQGKMHLKAECRRRRLEIFLWAALFEDESVSKAFNGLITILKIKHEVEAPKWLITDEEFPKTEKNVNFVWKQTTGGVAEWQTGPEWRQRRITCRFLRRQRLHNKVSVKTYFAARRR